MQYPVQTLARLRAIIIPISVCGGTGRDALRKSHSAAFLAKAREESAIQAVDTPKGVHAEDRRRVKTRTPRGFDLNAYARELFLQCAK